jgi:glycosyltransferase involved in cell wall biosynthesis
MTRILDRPRITPYSAGGKNRGLVIVHTEWSTGWGGQEIRTVSEARGVADRGHRVLIVAQPESQILIRARNAGLPTANLPMRSAFDLRAIVGLCSILRRVNADVLNTHSSVDSWIGALAAKITATKLVRTRHVSIPIRRHPLNFVHRLPDAVVTTGEAIRQQLILDGIVPDERVTSIATGVDLDYFLPRPHSNELRVQLGLPDGAVVLAFVAVLRAKKRHDILLHALARLRDRNGIYCVLAGEGGHRPVIEQLIRDLGLVDRVFLLGHVEDVRPVLAGADVVVSSSAGMEGVPQALIQALAMERPVVATADGSVGELVQHERTGLLVPPEQPDALVTAIERLLGERSFAQEYGRRGREHVAAHYSLERMIDAMLGTYRRVLA